MKDEYDVAILVFAAFILLLYIFLSLSIPKKKSGEKDWYDSIRSF